MKTEEEQDAYFLSMVSMICERHGIPFDPDMINMETRVVNFPTTNLDLQLIDDFDTLFSAYEV